MKLIPYIKRRTKKEASRIDKRYKRIREEERRVREAEANGSAWWNHPGQPEWQGGDRWPCG